MIRDEKSARQWVECQRPKPLEIIDEAHMLRAFYARTARKKSRDYSLGGQSNPLELHGFFG